MIGLLGAAGAIAIAAAIMWCLDRPEKPTQAGPDAVRRILRRRDAGFVGARGSFK